MLAEGGTLPDRADPHRARPAASARAWMRHLGRGMTAELARGRARPGRAHRALGRPTTGSASRRWCWRSRPSPERRGASGDPHADHRDAELAAHAACSPRRSRRWPPRSPTRARRPPEFSRRVAAWSRAARGAAPGDRGARRARRGARRPTRRRARPAGRGVGPRAGRARACRRRPRCGPTSASGRGPGARPDDAPRGPGLTRGSLPHLPAHVGDAERQARGERRHLEGRVQRGGRLGRQRDLGAADHGRAVGDAHPGPGQVHGQRHAGRGVTDLGRQVGAARDVDAEVLQLRPPWRRP